MPVCCAFCDNGFPREYARLIHQQTCKWRDIANMKSCPTCGGRIGVEVSQG